MYFEIRGTPIRIAGTMHVFPPGAPGLPSWLESAAKWTDQLCIEHLSRPEGLLHYATSPDGTIKPWGKLLVEVRRLASNAEPGVELGLDRLIASVPNKALLWLEEESDVAALLDKIPAKDVDEALKILQAENTGAEELGPMYRAWSTGSPSEVFKAAAKGPFWDVPKIRDAYFTQRNRRWAKRIGSVQAMPNKLLILVGCMHLVGPGNLIEAIKARGRRVDLLI